MRTFHIDPAASASKKATTSVNSPKTSAKPTLYTNKWSKVSSSSSRATYRITTKCKNSRKCNMARMLIQTWTSHRRIPGTKVGLSATPTTIMQILSRTCNLTTLETQIRSS